MLRIMPGLWHARPSPCKVELVNPYSNTYTTAPRTTHPPPAAYHRQRARSPRRPARRDSVRRPITAVARRIVQIRTRCSERFLGRCVPDSGSSRGFDENTSAAIETTMRVPVTCVAQEFRLPRSEKNPAQSRKHPDPRRSVGDPSLAARPGAPATARAKVPSRLIRGAAPAL